MGVLGCPCLAGNFYTQGREVGIKASASLCDDSFHPFFYWFQIFWPNPLNFLHYGMGILQCSVAVFYRLNQMRLHLVSAFRQGGDGYCHLKRGGGYHEQMSVVEGNGSSL